jgi:hypothetical protein
MKINDLGLSVYAVVSWILGALTVKWLVTLPNAETKAVGVLMSVIGSFVAMFLVSKLVEKPCIRMRQSGMPNSYRSGRKWDIFGPWSLICQQVTPGMTLRQW